MKKDLQRDLTLHQMRCFTELVEAGSISRAAARIGMTQSAMSRLLAQIEEVLGTSLAERSHHGLRLTDQGQLLNQTSHRILQAHDTMRSDMDALSGQIRGTCRVAMPESVGRVLFLPLIQSIGQQYPQSTLRVMAAFGASMPELLLSGQLDIAIVTNTHSHSGLSTEILARENFVLIARKGDPVTLHDTVPLEHLAGLPLILTAWSGGIRAPIDAAFMEAQITPNIHLEIDSNSTIVDLVQAGEGYSILPYSAVHREVQQGVLSFARLHAPATSRQLSLAAPANRPVSAISRAVLQKIKALMQTCKTSGGWHVDLGA